jgi:hypothetical protein
MSRKISFKNFFVSDVFNKSFIFNVFLMIIQVSKSSGLQRKHPPASPLPAPFTPQGCAGGGGEWIFSSTSRSFGYGYEAVRIRVNTNADPAPARYMYRVAGSPIITWQERDLVCQIF